MNDFFDGLRNLLPAWRNDERPSGSVARTVVLAGPIPPPVGGIQTHVAQLARAISTHGFECIVVDPSRSRGKERIPNVRHLMSWWNNSALSLLWLYSCLTVVSADVIHLHFSLVTGKFSIPALLLAKRGRKLVLTLHHGDQAGVLRRAGRLRQALAVVALRRVDQIVALSDEQVAFYNSLGLKRVTRWTGPFEEGRLPANHDLSGYPQLSNLQTVEDGGDITVLTTSGGPSSLYRYEACIEVLETLSTRMNCKLVVCLYGKGLDPHYERSLREALTRHPDIILVGPLSRDEFRTLLARSSVYLRPSTVDSYGLAISEALDVGTPCIASDVCARDPRCRVFPVDDREEFARMVMQVADAGRRSRRRMAIDPVSSGRTDILSVYRATDE